ncbi:MAG: CbiQ family ECF transporter T component [Mycobacterium sp.]
MTETRQPRPVVLLRPVPGTSPIHRLWAGTKLIVVFLLGVLLTFYPGWAPILGCALVIALAMIIGRIPGGAAPSVPWPLWAIVALGALTATFAGGSPHLSLGFVELGLGGLLTFLKTTSIAIVLLAMGLVVSWTTNVAEVAPAVALLGRPFRLFRLPVDEWAVAISLALRAFPMLIDEFRVLYQARRLRPRQPLKTRRERRTRVLTEIIDLTVASLTVALRRADEMGDAITARGGTGQISAAPSRPGVADVIAFVVVAVICGAGLALELTVWQTTATS